MISVNLAERVKEILFLFDLYYSFEQAEVVEIYKSFPYLFCTEPKKIRGFMQEFRKYRLKKDQIMHLCKNSGGLLGSSHKTFNEMFNLCKQNNVTSKRVINIMMDMP